MELKKFLVDYDMSGNMTPQQWDKIFADFKKALQRFWKEKGVVVNWE